MELDDGDGLVVGEREDACAFVFAADSEVVHASATADAHVAFAVDSVVAQAVVAGCSGAGWECFEGRAVGVPGGASVERSVWALFVVVVAEFVELSLDLPQAFGGRSGA